MPVCYFTYSWEKNSKKAARLDALLLYIKSEIEEQSNGNVSVIYDRESFHMGDNFRKKEQLLEESDAVLLFFTPEYKTKVESGDDTGVFREYNILKKRSQSVIDGVIPVLLSGKLETAVTAEFQDFIYGDISKHLNLVNVSAGKPVLGDPLHGLVNKIVRKAIKEAYAVSYCKDPVFQSMEEEFKILFLDSDNPELPRDCIIKTSAYYEIINQSSNIVIGRKGSGKSTLLDAIRNYSADLFGHSYKKLVKLDVDLVDLEYVYTSLISELRQEFNVIPMTDIIKTFWELVIVLQGLVVISHELYEFRIDQEDRRYHAFRNITSKLAILLGTPNQNEYLAKGTKGICHCAVELLREHIKNGNRILENASEITPLTAAYYSVDAHLILAKYFGETELREYSRALRICSKKILFALDGFDTHTDDFRITTDRMIKSDPDEYRARKDFEIRLFRELMLLVSTIKKKPQHADMESIYSATHFCVILPQERYDEIALDDRDISKRNYCSLNWDAHDLLEMLVRRLEHHYRVQPQENIPLNERFNNILVSAQ